MAETGKKGKKKKGKTVNLLEFLSDKQSSPASLNPVFNPKSSSSWADESEDLDTEVDNRWPEESYGGISNAKRQMDLAALPTAPRASLEVEIDYSKIPDQPPYTAFLGNLPYDVEKEDIMDFFKDVKISDVRLPQDVGGGRPKGFGYAEFDDKESLIQALAMSDETLRGRKLRIDIAGQNQGGGDRERDDRDDGPDLTMGDWRAMPDDSSSRSGGQYGSNNGYQDRNSRDGNRFERKSDEGGWGRDNDRGGSYGERDRNDSRSGRDSSDPYAGEEFTRDQARPAAAIKGPSSNNDSSNNRNDRGFGDQDRGYGGRDRGYGGGDRGYGDRDRGYGDRDRGYGDRDRGYGDRDRGYGDRDRGYGDRDRGYGDRDRGYGDRDRGYGGRDRGYGDRERGYGDGGGGRDFGDKDRRDYGSRGDQDDSEQAGKERPKLQLKPRTKPAQEKVSAPAPAESRSSIFGGAKPVDTTAKEREIEEKLAKLKTEPDLNKDYESFRDMRHTKEGEPRSHRDSEGRSSEARSSEARSSEGRSSEARSSEGRSSEGESRTRKDSGRSSEGERPAINHGRRDSEKSLEKEGTATNTEGETPPPVLNVWKQRMDAQTSGNQGKEDTGSKSSTEKPGSERLAERKVMDSNGPSSPVGSGSHPKEPMRGSERGGGAARGRGRGRGEPQSPPNKAAGDGGNTEEKKERRERKAPELKKVEDQPPVFHQNSKFSLLMDADEKEDEEPESAET